ncbi:MAG: hypothetical protein IJ724_09245, partial [Muribaculaceae bacterium]|nr:hypothetical protein [Muribaculaceae bacterium]
MVDFNYPQDVSKTALTDLDKALKGGDGKLVVDAIVRYSLAQSGISQDNMPEIVKRIESSVQQEKRPEYRALLHYFEACVFNAYLERYGLHDRENPDAEIAPDDYTEWDYAMFHNKIDQLLRQALSQPEELKRHPISEFDGIITCDEHGALLVPTLYQFLCQRAKELTDNETFSQEIATAWKQSVAGNIPAYIYACLENHADTKALYEQFKDNEHCGMALCNTYDDEMYSAFKDYVARFPQGYYTPAIRNKINYIERRDVSLVYPENLHSTDSVFVSLTTKNVNQLALNVYRVPDNLMKGRRLNVALNQLTLVSSQTVTLQGTVPFEVSGHTINLPPLPYGRYVIVPSYNVDGTPQAVSNINSYQLLTVSDIAMFYVTTTSNNNRLFAVDQRTGAPMPGVKIAGGKLTATTDAQGYITIPNTVQYDEFSATKGEDRYANTLNYRNFEHDDWKHISGQVFTDLAIYRPGETVKVAAILYHQSDNSRKVVANEPVRMRLMDTNGQDVDTITGATDEFGRTNGQFKLPTDRMNGQWCIAVEYGQDFDKAADWHDINVSEYKTPTFIVSFPDAKHNYVRKQPIKIEGKAETYSGMPVANAEVKLTLRQKSWSWWWRDFSTRNQGTVI